MDTGYNSGIFGYHHDHRPSETECQNTSLYGLTVGAESEVRSASVSDASDIQESDVVSYRNKDTAKEYEDSSSVEIVLSVVWYGGKLGAAYYEAESAVMYFLLEALELDSFKLMESLIQDLQPSVVVTSSKQDERFLDYLQKSASNKEDDGESDGNRTVNSGHTLSTDGTALYTLEILPNVSFAYETSKHRLIMASLPEIPDHYTDIERKLHISSKVSLDSIATVRASGGLMKYLEMHRIGVGLESTDVMTPILDFKMFSPKKIMYIDRSSYWALQIFKRLDHPSAFKIGTSGKEGLSLFRLMNRTKSRLGGKLLCQWFHRPLTNKNELERRLDAVEYFAHSRNADLSARLGDSLKRMRNINRILKIMKTATATVGDWLGLHGTVISAVSIADFCRNAPRFPDQRPLPKILADVAGCSTIDLIKIVKFIETVMDKEESMAQNTFVVQPGVDSDIDEKKHICNGLRSLLHEVALQECETYKDYITGCQIMYMRRIGYLLALKDDQKHDPTVDIPGLEYRMTSDGTNYYKTSRTAELDVDPGDILEEILDQEITIAHQLQNTVLEYTPALLKANQYIAELDCLLSYASVANDFGYVRPTISTENGMHVKGGRHPLQECTVSQFVPNDVALSNEDGRINIITGPNACGKSVYLKQVGLIAFMVQIGSFVPAEKAEMGLMNKMYTRIRTMESISKEMSTFAIDLNQMSASVSGADDQTLILVDEFGKGTATSDGVSLLAGCLTQWIDKKEKSPFILCSTHFHCLVKRSLLSQSPFVKYLTLETLRDENCDLVFLYELKEGVADCSFAAHLARRVGIPKEIIVRGSEMTELLRQNAPVRRYDSTSTTSYMKKCNSLSRKFLALDIDNDIAVKNFKNKEIQREMKTRKGVPRRSDSSCLSLLLSRNDSQSGRHSVNEECEQPIPPPKRRCNLP